MACMKIMQIHGFEILSFLSENMLVARTNKKRLAQALLMSTNETHKNYFLTWFRITVNNIVSC